MEQTATKALHGKPLTAKRIRNIAEYQISQREMTRHGLEMIFERRAFALLRNRPHEEAIVEREEIRARVSIELDRLVELGYLDDRRFAQMRARQAFRSGKGEKRIALDLQKKGISADIIHSAIAMAAKEIRDEVNCGLDDEGTEPESADFQAALNYARKKRLGPFASQSSDERERVSQRALASMARRGFSFTLARRVLEMREVPPGWA